MACRFANAPRIGKHFDLAAVALEVPPGAVGLIGCPDRFRDCAMRAPFIDRPDVEQRHRQELFARIAVMADRGVIDADESQAVRIIKPHRNRVAVEQQAERGLAQFEVGDVGQGDRQQVPGRAQSDLEMNVARVPGAPGTPGDGQLELIVSPCFEPREQPGREARGVEAAFDLGKSSPQQGGRGMPSKRAVASLRATI
jgi:hypothetical protein